MDDQTQHETLDFIDDKGCLAARLHIYAQPAAADNLIRLTDADAKEYGEEVLQICEGRRYEYVLEPADNRSLRLCLANDYTNEILVPSTIPNRSNCGQIVPGLRTGRLGLMVCKENGEPVCRTAIEIFSKKVSYRNDYRSMMEDITEQCTALLMELRSPTNLSVTPDPGSSPETIHQRFAFLRSLIDSRSFRNALHRITTNPHRRWDSEENIYDIRQKFRPTGSTLRQLAKGTKRVPMPDAHPLKQSISSLPESFIAARHVQTDDTPENRFVKFALKSFSGFLNKMRLKLEEIDKGSDALLRVEIASLEERLEAALSAEIFRGVSKPNMLPLGSPVLQRKEGYREVLQAWLRFDMAARLVWHGGEDVYGAGQRDIATLYEYWVYFKLLDIVSGIFKLDKPAAEDLLKKTRDGFGLQLKSGEYLPIEGVCIAEWRALRVRFSYNRTYSCNSKHTSSGSWSRNMRPDYTLSLWPANFCADDAEKQELMVHVHFDAKYRVDTIAELFGSEQDDMSEEKVQQQTGRYKRADLLKMHAYRDAIRRTQGAYVLYPGTETGRWKGYHEILPGLGAFPLRPGNGEHAIADFIKEVVRHVCDRATERERESFHKFKAHEMPPVHKGISNIPELEKATGKRHAPPAETFVLVGWRNSEEHLKWIRDKGLYNCRMDTTYGSIQMTPEMAAAKYMLLHYDKGETVPGLMRIVSEGPRVFSKAALIKAGYPSTPSQEYYLVYKVEPADEYDGIEWDYFILPNRPSGRASAVPFAVSLDAVVTARLKSKAE